MTSTSSAGESLDAAAELVGEVLDRAGVAARSVIGVGMGLPGPMPRDRRGRRSRRSCPAGSASTPPEEMSRRLGSR